MLNSNSCVLNLFSSPIWICDYIRFKSNSDVWILGINWNWCPSNQMVDRDQSTYQPATWTSTRDAKKVCRISADVTTPKDEVGCTLPSLVLEINSPYWVSFSFNSHFSTSLKIITANTFFGQRSITQLLQGYSFIIYPQLNLTLKNVRLFK